MSRVKHHLLPAVLAVLVVASAAGLGYAIYQNHQNRRDINRIIRPSPEQAREGIDRAIAQLTAAQAAAIFRKLPPELREQLRGPRGVRGPRGGRGPRGSSGASGPSGARGSLGAAGRAGGTGPAGRSGPQGAPPRTVPPPARVPTPRTPQLVPKVPAPFPPQGGLLPNGKPCPPRNKHCS